MYVLLIKAKLMCVVFVLVGVWLVMCVCGFGFTIVHNNIIAIVRH